MDDRLILPQAVMAQLRELAGSLAHRQHVWQAGGFDRSMPDGCGISVLFAGPPGTGKTLAARMLAEEAGAALVRVDAATIVGRSASETGQALDHLFGQQSSDRVVWLFDEADALFGSRSAVADAHARHATLELGYLLQRIEAYNGLAIVETQMPERIDAAIRARLARVIRFPMPGPEERRAMWHRAYPAEQPTSDLDFQALAERRLTGRQISRVAFEAAVLAFAEGMPVGMTHLDHALAAEP